MFLVLHPKGPKLPVKQVAKYAKTSVSYVKKWCARYTETGFVDNLPDRGETRSTDERTDNLILQLFEANPTLTLHQVHEKLVQKGITVSIETIRNRLHERQIKFKKSLLKPILTPNQIEKRLNWARENLDRDWTNVIFTDESSFWLSNVSQSAWSRKGNRFVQRTIKHPAKVHVYGCFSSNGFGKLIVFTGILKATGMIKLYRRGLLKSAEQLFGPENDDWILQEDNDPKHKSRLCREWKDENNVVTMDWPSQSPDANPIENVWAIMKHKLRRKRIRSTKQLKSALTRIWNSLSTDYAKNLAESCTQRCQHIIESGGDWTYY